MSDLELRDVMLRRGRRTVLDGVSIVFPAGQLTSIIGPNGAGKSTLLTVAAGLLAPDNGEVLLGGESLAAIGRRALARRRAYLPQNPRSDWPISVERLVALGCLPQLPAFGGLPASVATAVERTLAAHDLLSLRARPATELSGGELARAMLARATVADPALLIVDEPTAGLDPRHALDAARRLRAHADRGRTVLLAIHDLDLARRISDRVVALRDGGVLAAGAASTVLTRPVLERLYDVAARVDEGAIRFGD